MTNKIINETTLKILVSQIRDKNKKIVFTNGCFDILHIGHLRYLQSSKQLADCLIVGVNTDKSVKSIKGFDRPIVPETERAELISGLECVDYVILFEEETPIHLIGIIKPDVYTKGKDYTANNLPEAEMVLAYGGIVQILESETSQSTTRLVNLIKKTELVADGSWRS